MTTHAYAGTGGALGSGRASTQLIRPSQERRLVRLSAEVIRRAEMIATIAQRAKVMRQEP